MKRRVVQYNLLESVVCYDVERKLHIHAVTVAHPRIRSLMQMLLLQQLVHCYYRRSSLAPLLFVVGVFKVPFWLVWLLLLFLVLASQWMAREREKERKRERWMKNEDDEEMLVVWWLLYFIFPSFLLFFSLLFYNKFFFRFFPTFFHKFF